MPVSAWREGGSYTILIEHPAGRALVQGSAGFIPGALGDVRADAVFLGIGLLSAQGREYAHTYWRELVEATGAERVYPIHYDDFTRPYGELRTFPKLLDDAGQSLTWLTEFAAEGADRQSLRRLPLGQPVALFGGDSE